MIFALHPALKIWVAISDLMVTKRRVAIHSIFIT
jgi:hypothetical protein